jgi:predicted signal transduction protein with EAL and GGDEF domain
MRSDDGVRATDCSWWRELLIGSSIDVSVYPDHGQDVGTLMRRADLAMYAAKQAGRGAVRFYKQGLDTSVQQRQRIESALNEAMVRGEFELHYPPCVDIRTGRLVALEALLRWRHPTQGRIAPPRFIPAAEATGLIVPIGLWTIEATCHQLAAWRGHAAGRRRRRAQRVRCAIARCGWWPKASRANWPPTRCATP